MFSLRDYQEAAIENCRQAYSDGHQGVFLCLPTGAGKTVIFTEIVARAARLGKRCVVLAHRQELVWQASQKMHDYGINHGVMMGRHNTNYAATIQVCSIDTMRNRDLLFLPDIIIIDEAHLINSKRYKDFIDQYPKALRLLVSATPTRLDGKGFDGFASHLVVGSTIRQLTAEGYLVPARVFVSPLGFSLKDVKRKGRDFDTQELSEKMSTVQLVGDVVGHYKEEAMGKRAVCFAVDVEHSKKLADAFNASGIPAQHLDGKTSEVARRHTLNALSDGRIKVVTNCGILCEGWDEPKVECVILARPTESEALYIQQAGRGLRPCPEIGKEECIILDHAENVLTHGLIDELREWSLSGRVKKPKGKKKKETLNQDEDLAGITGARLREIEEIEARLIEISNLDSLEYVILMDYNQECRKAAKNGFKKGWAFYRTADRYGVTALIKLLGASSVPYGLKQSHLYGDQCLAAKNSSLEELVAAYQNEMQRYIDALANKDQKQRDSEAFNEVA